LRIPTIGDIDWCPDFNFPGGTNTRCVFCVKLDEPEQPRFGHALWHHLAKQTEIPFRASDDYFEIALFKSAWSDLHHIGRYAHRPVPQGILTVDSESLDEIDKYDYSSFRGSPLGIEHILKTQANLLERLERSDKADDKLRREMDWDDATEWLSLNPVPLALLGAIAGSSHTLYAGFDHNLLDLWDRADKASTCLVFYNAKRSVTSPTRLLESIANDLTRATKRGWPVWLQRLATSLPTSTN